MQKNFFSLNVPQFKQKNSLKPSELPANRQAKFNRVLNST